MIKPSMGKKLILIMAVIVLAVGCNPATPVQTPEATKPATPTSEGYPAPYPVSTALFPAIIPTVETYPEPGTSETTAGSAYPVETEESSSYPAPELTQSPVALDTQPAYPGPQTTQLSSSPQPGDTYPSPYPGPGEQPTQPGTTQAAETPTSGVPGTQAVTPTAFLPEYQLLPVPQEFTTVSIWHSWSGLQLQVLEQAIRVYQSMQPSISFDLLYVPYDELNGKFEAAAYLGEGPSLVFGDSDWVAKLTEYGLVEDLTPYLSDEFVETLSAPALGAVQTGDRTFALPYAMRGVVLYRNKKLVPAAPESFEQLLEYTEMATQSGNVGLYLDWGCYFSCAQMQGSWLDDHGQVQFEEDNYQAASGWLSQLQQIKESGALVEFNQDQALNLFKLGKIGMTMDGSWRAWELSNAIGNENLAIDPWPVNGSGRMAGYVQADAIFLNSNTGERSLAEEQAALRFMGLLLTPEVQIRLAEAGFIPTVIESKPRDEVKTKLMVGLNSGKAFPTAWQGEVRQAYWSSIDAAAQAVLERAMPARQAMETAAIEIKERLSQIENR